MFTTIVVVYDGSTACDLALDRAAGLASAFDSSIALVVVEDQAVTLPSPPIGYAEAALAGTAVDGRERLHAERIERARSAFDRLGATYELVTPAGSAEAAVVEVAERHDADLVVVGTSERGFLERLVFGDLSGALARAADCDVLVVHDKAKAKRPGLRRTGSA
jgi:nucleotide-binding universal stress UspA family protein